jgi:hypothetical protein
MKHTDFKRTCESPSVVTLWAGALCPRQEKTLIHAPLLANAGGGAFCFWWAAWRGGKQNPHQPGVKLMGTREMGEEQYVERRLVTGRANAMPK